MENAGQLIEDEDLREQIKGSGIGTSATRAEIVKKLVSNKYIALNKKTQIVNTDFNRRDDRQCCQCIHWITLKPNLNRKLGKKVLLMWQKEVSQKKSICRS